MHSIGFTCYFQHITSVYKSLYIFVLSCYIEKLRKKYHFGHFRFVSLICVLGNNKQKTTKKEEMNEKFI